MKNEASKALKILFSKRNNTYLEKFIEKHKTIGVGTTIGGI